jgi:biopolymer transport protein ExbD
MKSILEVCLIALAMAAGTPSTVSQTAADVPMQRGVSVVLPATHNAIAVPDADKEDALVVTVTRYDRVWLGVNLLGIDTLAERVRSILSSRTDKTLYIKVDRQVAYATVVQVFDAVRTTGVEGITLLTSQRDADETGNLVTPKGLEMRIVEHRVNAKSSRSAEERP